MSNSVEFQMANFKLPPRYKDIEWSDLVEISKADRKHADKYISEYPNNKKECLYLSNKISGTGKTSYAICLTKDLIKQGKMKTLPLFVSFRVLMEHMRQDKDGSFLQNDMYKKVLESPFTIFDDVGVERITASVVDRYILLLEQLWLKKKHAIFTSKFTINGLINRGKDNAERELLESIASRLVGMCEEIVLNNNRDYRV